jgi:hypothetical protein
MTWRKLLPFAVLLMTAVTLSAQSEDMRTSPVGGMQVLNVNGVGTATGSGLTHTSVGVVKGTVFGAAKFTASLSDDRWSLSGNGSGGACVRGSGSIVLSTPDGSTLTMQQAGLSCNPWKDPNNLIDNAAYLIVGGTGRFSGAAGTGNVVTGIMSGQTCIHFDGNIVFGVAKSGEDGTHEGHHDPAEPSESTGFKSGHNGVHFGGGILVEDAKQDEDCVGEKCPEGRHGHLTWEDHPSR